MAFKKNEPAAPSLALVILVGLLTLALGKVLAMVSLATQPAVELAKAPDADSRVPGTVYFIKGAESRDRFWEAKWKAVESGQPIAVNFSEGDLNAWARRQLATEAPQEPGKFTLTADRVNFRVTGDNLLQVAAYIKAPGLFPARDFLLQVEGTIAADNGHLRFTPVRGYLGKAPVGFVPVLRDYICRTVGKLFLGTEGGAAVAGLQAIASAEVVDGELVVRPAS